MRPNRKILTVSLMMGVMAPALTACGTSEWVRELFGYQTQPDPIVEERLSPCMQPHRGSSDRDCSGKRIIYTPRNSGRKQQF